MAKLSPIEIASIGTTSGLANALQRIFYELYNVLRNLSFRDNCGAFLWEGTIPISTEVKIPHNLKVVPAGYLIVKQVGGVVDAGVTDWTTEHVYVRNTSGASAAVVKILFFKTL